MRRIVRPVGSADERPRPTTTAAPGDNTAAPGEDTTPAATPPRQRERDPAAGARSAWRSCSSGARRRLDSGGVLVSRRSGRAGEGDGDSAHRAAAVRELREESAIELTDPRRLVAFSRWITPRRCRSYRHSLLPRALPDCQQPSFDEREWATALVGRRRRSTPRGATASGAVSRRSSTSSICALRDGRRAAAHARGATSSRSSRRSCSRERSRASAGRATRLRTRRRQAPPTSARPFAPITCVTAIDSARGA